MEEGGVWEVIASDSEQTCDGPDDLAEEEDGLWWLLQHRYAMGIAVMHPHRSHINYLGREQQTSRPSLTSSHKATDKLHKDLVDTEKVHCSLIRLTPCTSSVTTATCP